MDNIIFNPQRFFLLLKKELNSGNKKLLIIIGAAFGLMLFFAAFMIYANQGYHELNFNYFPLLLFGGGFVFTSVVFHEFNEKTGVHHYLSLPASTFEKFASKWLISAIVFPIVFVILFFIYVQIADWMYYRHGVSIVEDYRMWHLDNWWSWFFLKIYFVIQTLFLVGAIAFQKFTFFKTSLTSILIFGLSALLFAIVFRMVYADHFETLFKMKNINTRPNDAAINFLNNGFLDILKFIFWYILPVTMLIIGFFKLKEKEA